MKMVKRLRELVRRAKDKRLTAINDDLLRAVYQCAHTQPPETPPDHPLRKQLIRKWDRERSQGTARRKMLPSAVADGIRIDFLSKRFPKIPSAVIEELYFRVEDLGPLADKVVREGGTTTHMIKRLREASPGFPDDIYRTTVSRAIRGTYY
jgi:hypothetical protein